MWYKIEISTHYFKDDGASSDEEIGAEADAEESKLAQRHHDDAAEYEGEDVEKIDIGSEQIVKVGYTVSRRFDTVH